MRRCFLLTILGLTLFSTAIAQPAPDPASDVLLTWSAAPFASGYKIHVGTNPADLTPVDVSNSLHVNILPGSNLVPRDCTLAHARVSAYNLAGESGMSPPASFYARPRIDPGGLHPSTNPQVWIVEGTSFGPAATLLINGNLVAGVVRDSCTQLSFQAVSVPDASTWSSVTVCNGTICSSYVPIPDTPTMAPAVL
jgi:hypothetical protein